METWRNGDMDIFLDITLKTEARAIFLNPFTISHCSKGSLSFVRFFNEETNRSYPFAYGLDGLNGLALLWLQVTAVVNVLKSFYVVTEKKK
jgi:hypothetical protein